MALQLSAAVRNARLDAIETTIIAGGGTSVLDIYSGAMPANTAAAATGTLLCSMNLPADFMANAGTGAKAKSGTWSGVGTAGASTGTAAGYFRIRDSAGTPVCHVQGTVTATGGGGDMTLDNVSIATNQTVTVNTFQLTDANA